MTLTVACDGGAISAVVYRSAPAEPVAALVLAHGAGAGQGHPFMVAFARAWAASGIDVLTFNFPYMEQKRKVPDRAPILEACYRRVIDTARQALAGSQHGLFIGGKSMGGRMATHVAAADPSLPIAGILLLGYPLHPPGQPDRRRDAHLPRIHVPVLIVQGARDTFGTPEELQPALDTMSPRPTLHVVPDGDHSFKVRGADKARQARVEGDIQQAAADWMKSIVR